MHFRHLHTTILRSSKNRTITSGQRQNTNHLFESPANKPPARPRSNNFKDSDIVKCTVDIRNYMRDGQCDTALRLFNLMPHKDEVTYTTMISGYFSNGKYKLVQKLFDEMPVKNLITWNIMIKWNIKNNNLGAARRLFDDMPEKDVVSWTTILFGYMQNGLLDEATRIFYEMPVKNVVSWTTFLFGYVQKGLMDEAKRVFHKMHVKNVFSWNTILSGYMKNGFLDEGTRIFHEMPVKNVFSWTTFLSGYVQNGLLNEAKRVFDEMPHRDSSSWATMIDGYSKNGEKEEALWLFIESTRDLERLSNPAFASVLSTCADIAAFELGKQLHGCVVKGGFEFKCNVGSALVSMYCRCGSIKEAYEVFKRIGNKDVIAWSTIINGYARHGFGQEALQLFESMKQASIQPDEVTMVGVLTACSHTGLVDKGTHYFYSMSKDHGIVPNIKHYNCMIDLLGRAGRLDEAQNLMKSMPFKPDAATWGSLLGASRIHGNIELGEKAAEMLFDLEPWSSSVYVFLSRLYATSGRWEDVEKIRLKMRGRGVIIRPGYSWVEVLNKVHKFYAEDFTHPDSESIRAFLEELDVRMKEDGYVSSTKSALHDVDEEEKQHTLKSHSEKLAVAYGIMKIPSGRPVRVFKNLHVCEDCHTAIKHVSKISGRLIILRDVKRFHHFEGGVCNCGDYW